MKSNSEPNLPPPATSKKPRALPCVWMRFWHLDLDESFSIGAQKFVRTGLFTARPYAKAAQTVEQWGTQTPWQFVAPWTRVKTTRLVRAAKSSIHGTPISREKALEGLGDPATWPAHEAKLLADFRARPNPGKTHFVGDDCPGGHGEFIDQIRPRVEQPNSDNSVTGPTS